jgi:hypothetical protein
LKRAPRRHAIAPCGPRARGVCAGGPDRPTPHASTAAARIPGVDLGRIAWLMTVLACLVAVLVLLLNGYYGYAGVTMAVAISAAINLL